jgi:hypothetical protein
MNGKGDKKRQLEVSYEVYARNFDRIFQETDDEESIPKDRNAALEELTKQSQELGLYGN